MTRITLPTLEKMNAEQRKVYDSVINGPRGRLAGPLRAALLNPELAARWSKLGELLRYSTSLPRHLSELAILVTAEHCQSPLEWAAHKQEGEKAGLASDIVDAIAQRQPITGDSDEAIVWAYADELNRINSVTDETYTRAFARFGDVAVMELTALIGYYTMVAMTLNAHEIPLPDGFEPAPFPLPQHAGTDHAEAHTQSAGV